MKWSIIGACGFVVTAGLFNIEMGSRRHFACAVCRLGRHDLTFLGLTRSTYEANECSEYYRRNVEPTHAHRWANSGCSSLLNAWGQRIGFACGRSSPIFRVPVGCQLAFYRHVEKPLEYKPLFLRLGDPEFCDVRLGPEAENQGDLLAHAICEWGFADFPGTWDGYWTLYYAKHVSDSQAWQAEGKQVRFREWKNGRKEQVGGARESP